MIWHIVTTCTRCGARVEWNSDIPLEHINYWRELHGLLCRKCEFGEDV